MRKRKWLIPVIVATVLVVGGITGGLVLAGSDNSAEGENQLLLSDRCQELLERVCAIYEERTGVAIDAEQLREALEQAREEMREEALENRLEKLVEEGKITQEEADQYLEWWQSRPDIEVPLPGLRGARGGMMWGKGWGPFGKACNRFGQSGD